MLEIQDKRTIRTPAITTPAVRFAIVVSLHALLATTGCFLGATKKSQPADYLAAPIRARVDRIAENIDGHPTDAQTAEPRLRAALQWARALERRDAPAPAHLDGLAARIFGAPPGAKDTAAWARLDESIAELKKKDKSPGILGRWIALDGVQSADAGSTITLRLVYIVPQDEIGKGGAILVQSPRGALLQNDDPQTPNYVSIRSSNPAAEWSAETLALAATGPDGEDMAPQPLFRLKAGNIPAGERIDLTLGDTTQTKTGFHLPSTPGRLAIPILISYKEDAPYLTPSPALITLRKPAEPKPTPKPTTSKKPKK